MGRILTIRARWGVAVPLLRSRFVAALCRVSCGGRRTAAGEGGCPDGGAISFRSGQRGGLGERCVRPAPTLFLGRKREGSRGTLCDLVTWIGRSSRSLGGSTGRCRG